MSDRGLQVVKSLRTQEVYWTKVLELLSARHKLSFSEADSMVRSFMKRAFKPLALSWFFSPHLSDNDNRVVAAICDCHGSDQVSLDDDRQIVLGILRVQRLQRLAFNPERRSEIGTGKCVPYVEMQFLGQHLIVRSAYGALAIYLVLSVVAASLALLFSALLLYGIAVFFVFVKAPIQATRHAAVDWSFFLALLCFLVGAAGVCGRACANLFRLVRSWIKLRRAHSNTVL